MSDVEKYIRRIEREKKARKQAEQLLEQRSKELYDKNLELFTFTESLEQQVIERTYQLEQAKDEAIKALRTRSDFITNMSHELRTPLNGVLGILDLLKRESLTNEQAELVETALSSGNHLLETINDILDFSKLEAGKFQVEYASFNLHQTLNSIMAPFHLQASKKSIQLNLNIADDVCEYIVSDKLHITQILTNLMSNAVKFTSSGVVECNVSMKQNELILSVKDTGIGMSKSHQATIFDAFEQADTSITRQFGGTGLGMNISARLIKMLNGNVSVSSELGEGTQFDVHIPVERTSAPMGQQIEKTLSNAIRAEHLSQCKNKKVLLVEDNAVNQMVASKLLCSYGLSVDVADNGLLAIQKLTQEPNYDLIFMDLQMPEMGGVEAATVIRTKPLIEPKVPIVAMTAHTTSEHIDECLEAGMNAHISKPINRQILEQALVHFLVDSNGDHTESSMIRFQSNDNSKKQIDYEAALDRVGGDQDLLVQLMSRFFDENGTPPYDLSVDTIKQYSDEFEVYFHKVKGSGGNLGFIALSNISANIERSIKSQNFQQIESLFSDFDSSLSNAHAFYDSFKDEVQHSINVQDFNNDKPSISSDEIMACLKNIQELLNKDISSAENELKDVLSHSLDEGIEQPLTQALDALQCFDIKRVSTFLTQTIEALR